MKTSIAISYADLEVQLEALERAQLPAYKGSAFRGALGHSLRTLICTSRDKDCIECSQKYDCAYSYIYETPPPKNTRLLPKYDNAPHPFIFDPAPGDQTIFLQGENLPYRLLLFGQAIKYLPIFTFALANMAGRGLGAKKYRFRLDKVLGTAGENKKAVIYDYKEQVVRTERLKTQILQLEEPKNGTKAVRIKFITPCRIQYEGHVSKALEFHILVRNLLRRISLMNYFHGNGINPEMDFKQIIDRARGIRMEMTSLEWKDWQRYSNRQQSKIEMGGFVGEAVYTGDLAEFMPLLKLGEALHIGKGTVFGLGKYECQKA
jgi:CRISPR-associated endoribonuclease Cas6